MKPKEKKEISTYTLNPRNLDVILNFLMNYVI